MRKFLFLLLLFLAIVFVFLSFSELQHIADTLERSNWIFLTFAFLFAALWLYNVSVTWGTIYRLMDLVESRRQLFLLTAAFNFINVIAPSAGIGGMAVFIDSARQRGQPGGRVTVAGVIFALYDYAAFLCVLTLGIIVLVRRNNLTTGEITASVLLVMLALGFATLLYLGYRSSERLGNLLAAITRLINRLARPFIHRDLLKEENAHTFARDMAEGVRLARGKRKGLMMPFLFALNSKAMLLCVLAFTFLALGTPFSVGTLVGGFSVCYLFQIISPTPSGVGMVESLMPVALNSLRVPWAAAVLITLVYRAVTFWAPLLVGAIALRILHRQPQK